MIYTFQQSCGALWITVTISTEVSLKPHHTAPYRNWIVCNRSHPGGFRRCNCFLEATQRPPSLLTSPSGGHGSSANGCLLRLVCCRTDPPVAALPAPWEDICRLVLPVGRAYVFICKIATLDITPPPSCARTDGINIWIPVFEVSAMGSSRNINACLLGNGKQVELFLNGLSTFPSHCSPCSNVSTADTVLYHHTTVVNKHPAFNYKPKLFL